MKNPYIQSIFAALVKERDEALRAHNRAWLLLQFTPPGFGTLPEKVATLKSQIQKAEGETERTVIARVAKVGMKGLGFRDFLILGSTRELVAALTPAKP